MAWAPEDGVEGGHVSPDKGETGGHVLEFAVEAFKGLPWNDVAGGSQGGVKGGAVAPPFGLGETNRPVSAREPTKKETH